MILAQGRLEVVAATVLEIISISSRQLVVIDSVLIACVVESSRHGIQDDRRICFPALVEKLLVGDILRNKNEFAPS